MPCSIVNWRKWGRNGIFIISGSVFRESVEMRLRLIERCRIAFPNCLICRCLNVSQNGYYGWCGWLLCDRAKANQRLRSRIEAIHTDSDGVMGSLRIWEELQYAGIRYSQDRVAWLMRVNGIQGIPQKRRWRKRNSDPRPVGIQNHLARDFAAGEPNSKCVTDFTNIETVEGWLCISAVLDLYSGIVLGWSMS
ncbi:MAG: IS3 family transposase, partial [Desulfobacterales bacterium]|nr:IS3 family transposase [Desulfobacterales bacterium]